MTDLEDIVMVPLQKSDIDFILSSFDMLRHFLVCFSNYSDEDMRKFDFNVSFLTRLLSFDVPSEDVD